MSGGLASLARNRFVVGAVLAALCVGAVVLSRGKAGSGSTDVPAHRHKGPATAPVLLTEFLDFQCPSCGTIQPALRDFMARHPNDLRLVVRYKLWRNHKWAWPAARAAESAGRQGKFWEYAELLFANQKEWSEAAEEPRGLFVKYAQQLNLDAKRFEDGFSRLWDGVIERDMAAAEEMNVESTPTIFINKRRLVGEQQLKNYGDLFLDLEKRG